MGTRRKTAGWWWTTGGPHHLISRSLSHHLLCDVLFILDCEYNYA